MSTDTSPTREALAQNLRSLVDEAEALLKNAAKAGDAEFAVLRERISAQATQLRQQLESLEEGALKRARQAAHVTDEAVHSHPYTAIAVAAAVGALVGVLLTRKD